MSKIRLYTGVISAYQTKTLKRVRLCTEIRSVLTWIKRCKSVLYKREVFFCFSVSLAALVKQ